MTVIRNFQKCLAMNTIYDVTKIVAANALGNYHPQDPVDFFIVNVEIIVTITVDKIVSNGLRIFVPYFQNQTNFQNAKVRFSYYGASGIISSAVSTCLIYPLQVYRAKRNALRNHKDGEPLKEVSPSLSAALVNFTVNCVPAAIDVAINFARDHTEQIALIAIGASFAAVQYAITGGYRKITQRMFPKALI